MKRWLFNIAAGGSLLAGLLVVVLWIRSEFVLEYMQHRSPPLRTHYLSLGVSTFPGAVDIELLLVSWVPQDNTVGWGVAEGMRRNAIGQPHYGSAPRSQYHMHEQHWFIWNKSDPPLPDGVSIIQDRLLIPDWFPLLLSSVLPTIWLIKFRRCHKLAGCCPKCGYDLRATPDRCPECGTVVAQGG